jgi:hypothetical protein
MKTRDGAGYVALVTHMGQTSIVAVGKGGKITDSRYLEVSLKKVKGAAFGSVMVLNAGVQLGDDPSTPGVTENDFVLGYEGPGGARYSLRTARGSVLPPGGGALSRTTPLPLDLTQIGTPIVSVAIGGSVTIGDLMISPPAAPARGTAAPEPALPALLGTGAALLAWRAQRQRSR